jgi:hypothetical protein
MMDGKCSMQRVEICAEWKSDNSKGRELWGTYFYNNIKMDMRDTG